MMKDLQDRQRLDLQEEDDCSIYKRFSARRFSFPASTRCPLLLYGLFTLCTLLLTIIIIVIAINNSREKNSQKEQLDLFSNFTLSMQSFLQAFQSNGGHLMDLENSLKALESDRSQVGNLQEKLKVLTNTLEKIESVRANDKTQEDLQALKHIVSLLKCDVERLTDNDTRSWCCPEDWTTFSRSCYSFSRAKKSWPDAKNACESEQAYLVVINTASEEAFIEKWTIPYITWIGLSEPHGQWEWVDGTSYSSTPKSWLPGQPSNYYHPGKGVEDCAEVHTDGRWNDNHCSLEFPYVCERKMA